MSILNNIMKYLSKVKASKYITYILLFSIISLFFVNISALQLNRVNIEVGGVSPRTFIAQRSIRFQDKEVIEERKKEYRDNPNIYYKYQKEKEKWVDTEFEKLKKITANVSDIVSENTTETLYSELHNYAEKQNINFDLIIAINNLDLDIEFLESEKENILSFISRDGGFLEDDLNNKAVELKQQVSNRFEHPILEEYLHNMIDLNLKATKVVDTIKTLEAKDNAFYDIEESNTISIKSGQKIVGQNEIITDTHHKIINELGLASSDFEIVKQVKLNILYIIIIIGLIISTRSIKDIYEDKNRMFLLGILFTTGTIIISLSLMFEIFSTYLLLFYPLVIILTDIFISKRISIFTNIVFSIIIAHITSNITLMLSYLVAGLIISLVLKDIKNRSDMLKFGLISTIITLSIIYLLDMNQHFELNAYLLIAFNIITSFFISTSTFSFIEKKFNILTPFSLMELEHHPILDELSEKAPGTMIHSRNVAYLAKKSAIRINANYHLVFTGGLLHDIGKLHKPKMFSENHAHFNLKTNPMDDLTPIEAANIIKKHIEYGYKLANELKLPKSIVDLIKTHHGNSVIKYFYYKASKEAEENNETPPLKGDYQYHWGKPQTKEEGILLLADIAEAVSKSFDDTSRDYISERLPKYLDNVIADGQLDECNLSLKELNLIKESLIDGLVSLNLKRVKYQNQKD